MFQQPLCFVFCFLFAVCCFSYCQWGLLYVCVRAYVSTNMCVHVWLLKNACEFMGPPPMLFFPFCYFGRTVCNFCFSFYLVSFWKQIFLVQKHVFVYCVHICVKIYFIVAADNVVCMYVQMYLCTYMNICLYLQGVAFKSVGKEFKHLVMFLLQK